MVVCVISLNCENGFGCQWFVCLFAGSKTITVGLPVDAQGGGTVLRWRQLTHSGSSYDEWALDHISITSTLYDRRPHEFDFQLNMGCGVPYTHTSTDYDAYFEYSTDYGATWKLTQASCSPSTTQCTQNLVSVSHLQWLGSFKGLLLSVE